MSNKLANKASEAAAAARRLVDMMTNGGAKGADGSARKSRKVSRGRQTLSADEEDDRRCASVGDAVSSPFGFLDNMCGPLLSNLRQAGRANGDAEDDLTAVSEPPGGRQTRSRRRPTGSLDHDDETNVTDVTSYDEDDETYDTNDRKGRSVGHRRGRDRKPRNISPTSASEITAGKSEEVDDAVGDMDTEFSSVVATKKDKDKNSSSSSSSAHHSSRREKGNSKSHLEDDSLAVTGLGSEKLISQPLASGFAKRCYFTKAGIGRNTQHYEGLTLTGNTVLMLASAMKLKGCPTICDEDLRRVEQTYPNQFSRLPDELLLSSGWRRISKYCHFSHKPLPDGVPFFHSKRRCHPGGGFYFLLCSAVGMARLMDVEPLNRDALAVLQTDFPVPCEKAPKYLLEDPEEWTLVNKFCFFSGGPINLEEDVYYKATLGGTEIFMLAFLSPSLSPDELYRLKPRKTEKENDSSPLMTVAAVEEVESVYDLMERDFDDLKLYHLGPCRALPPYLLHPEAWIKVLPPHFVTARDEAMRRAMEFENRNAASAQISRVISRGPQDGAAAMIMEGKSGYVELGGPRGGITPVGPGFPAFFSGQPIIHPQQPLSNDQNTFYPSQGPNGISLPFHPQQQQLSYGALVNNEMNYYYRNASPMPQHMIQNATSRGMSPFLHPNLVSTTSPHLYGNKPNNLMGYSDDRFNLTPPQNMIADPHWKDVQEEGAFGMSPVIGGDQPHDEALATRVVGATYSTVDGGGMMQQYLSEQNQYHIVGHFDDPLNAEMHKSMFHCNNNHPESTTPMRKDIQDAILKEQMNTPEKHQRMNLSTKFQKDIPQVPEDSTWETRTEGESSYGTSLVSGSSVYTDTTNPNERNSRRALILQMAKARMKNVKQGSVIEKKMELHPEADISVNCSHAPPREEFADEVAHLELD